MKVLCKHCQNTCKKIGVVNCDSYNAIANRPEQLKTEIRKAYQNKDYELGQRLENELFIREHGSNI